MSSCQEIDVVDTVIAGSVNAVLDLDIVKLHLGALTGYDDVLIESWVTAATQFIEEQTGRQLITATREILLDRFPGSAPYGWPGVNYSSWPGYTTYQWPAFGRGLRIELPRPPLQSVVSVQYVDTDGTVQDFVDDAAAPLWQVKNVVQAGETNPHQRRGWIEPVYGHVWPMTRAEGGAVRIRYVAGYGDTDDLVPDLLKAAVQYLVGNFEQNRSTEAFRTGFAELPMNVSSILQAFERTARSSTVLR